MGVQGAMLPAGGEGGQRPPTLFAGIFELAVTSFVLRREENKTKTLTSPYIYWLLGFLHVVKYDNACSQI